MIFPLVESAVVVLNARVTGTLALAGDRSLSATVIPTAVTKPIPPDAAPADATGSASVCTVMPVLLPAVAAPMVKPLRVMTKAVFAGMPAVAVVMTMEVSPGAADVAVMAATDVVPAALAEGVVDVAKNPDG